MTDKVEGKIDTEIAKAGVETLADFCAIVSRSYKRMTRKFTIFSKNVFREGKELLRNNFAF